MNISDNTEFQQHVSSDEDIFIDDMPVDNLLYKNSVTQDLRPADLTLLWAGEFPMTSEMKEALAIILVNRINIAFSLKKIKEAEILILEELHRLNDDPSLKLKFFIALLGLYEKTDPVKKEKYFEDAKKIVNDHAGLFSNEVLDTWKSFTDSTLKTTSPFELRETALDLLESGYFDDAEKIYNRLLIIKFDLPGTLCHLARVQLLKQDVTEAEKSVHSAWKLREKASGYVLLRIIFFKILFLLLLGKDPSVWVKRIKKTLTESPGFMVWNICTTLKIYQTAMAAEHYRFLMSLADALQNKQNLWALEKFELWNRK